MERGGRGEAGEEKGGRGKEGGDNKEKKGEGGSTPLRHRYPVSQRFSCHLENIPPTKTIKRRWSQKRKARRKDDHNL